jgi:hypothetical protein
MLILVHETNKKIFKNILIVMRIIFFFLEKIKGSKIEID